jgi:hypothetical protein
MVLAFARISITINGVILSMSLPPLQRLLCKALPYFGKHDNHLTILGLSVFFPYSVLSFPDFVII